VLLRVTAAGVCGTDVHLVAGEFGPVYPLTPGHEIAGVVTGVGRVQTGGMVTHQFGLPDYGAAIKAAAGDSGCLKALVRP
jgi:threonine dehydrogenase-like Zn-dependent dehydrogenase